MQKSIVEFNDVVVLVKYGESALLDRLPFLSNLGNRDSYRRNGQGLSVEFDDFYLEQGKSIGILGDYSLMIVLTSNILSGNIDISVGKFSLGGTLLSAPKIKHEFKMESTVSEQLATVLKNGSINYNAHVTKIEEMLVYSGMTYAANIPIKNLSELEIQKLAITKALYCDSEVVIIDDDFFICDETFVAKVRDTVSLQKNSGRSFIFSVVRGRELTGLVDRQVNCRFC